MKKRKSRSENEDFVNDEKEEVEPEKGGMNNKVFNSQLEKLKESVSAVDFWQCTISYVLKTSHLFPIYCWSGVFTKEIQEPPP